MAGFDNLYPNLPGHLVEFKDGGLALRVEADPPKTKSMLILGTAIDGPVLEPIAVDAATAEVVFGKPVKGNGIPNGSTLVPAFEEAWNAGCRDIRLMRISGTTAKSQLVTAPVKTTQQMKNDEHLGVSQGNDLTVLTLAHKFIVGGSVVVNVKGSPLADGFTVDSVAGTVTIAANTVDAGASVQVQYQYEQVADYDETLVTEDDGNGKAKVNLTYVPADVAGIKVTKDGAAVADITVTNKVVVINSGVAIGDTVDVKYTGISDPTPLSSTDSGTGLNPFLTATSEQVIVLAQSPIPGTLHLYANGAEVLTPGAFTVDGTLKEVKLKKEFVPKGSSIEITYMYNQVDTVTPSIQLETHYGGELYNQVKKEVVAIKDNSGNVIGVKVIITKPESKKAQIAEEPLTYSSIDYPNFRLMVQAINADVNNGIVKAVTNYDFTDTTNLLVCAQTYFAGGTDGVNMTKEQLFAALSGERNSDGFLTTVGAYQLLEDYQVDYIIPVGVYADDDLPGKNDNFAYELAMVCAVLSYRNKTTIGCIGMRPVVDTGLASISTHAKKLANYYNYYFMKDQAGNILKDSSGKPIDLGRWINVVGGPDVIVNGTSLGSYNTNAAVLYASFNTTLNAQSAPTNKELPGALALRYRFSNAQLDDITGNRIVTLRTKPSGNVAVVDGMTAANPSSDYRRLSTVKVTQEVVDQIREVCDPFIGEPNTIEQRNAMSAAISKRLGVLKQNGVIQDSEFQVVASQMDQILGQAKIELSLVPPQELRRITTIVSLKASL